MRKQYTKEELIQSLRNFKQITGMVPTQNTIRKKDGYHDVKTYVTCFGTWNEALKAASLHIRTPSEWANITWTKEKCITAIKKFYEKNNRIPKAIELRKKNGLPDQSVLVKHYGTINQAMEAAGYIPYDRKGNNTPQGLWSRDTIADALNLFYDKNGNYPSSRLWRKKRNKEYPICATVNKHFGTFKNAVEYANQKRNDRPAWYHFYGE